MAGAAATLVGALRAAQASFRAGQRRLVEGLLKLVKGKVKKKRSSMTSPRRICGCAPNLNIPMPSRRRRHTLDPLQGSYERRDGIGAVGRSRPRPQGRPPETMRVRCASGRRHPPPGRAAANVPMRGAPEGGVTPGELLLEAGYRQCLCCGRLFTRDGVPARHLTEDERGSFTPCASLGDVCVECSPLTPPTAS
jgi:hypothetical protein